MIKGQVYSPKSDEETELWFKAKMTERQFQAISLKFEKLNFVNEIQSNLYFQEKVKISSGCSIDEVEKYLKNSLNTENVLFQNKKILESSESSFIMQWAFPQAYYSVFTSILALYKIIGQTQTSHSAVLSNYARQYSLNHFPSKIAFYADGVKSNIRYFNIDKPSGLDSMDFNKDNDLTVDNQICQALKSTREMKLDERSEKTKYKNPGGVEYKRLPNKVWLEISKNIGYTTILDYLYRKRIKANYLDIDTFSSDYFDGLLVLKHLCHIVDRLNFMNEMYMAKCLGKDKFFEMNRRLKINLTEFQSKRLSEILDNI